MQEPRPATVFAKNHFKGKTDLIVEVGVGNATNALSMREALRPEKMYLVDPWVSPDWWPNKEYTDNENNDNCKMVYALAEKNKDLIIIKETSVNALDIVPDSLDLVYIDAVHAEPYITQDIEGWLKKIRVGGILCGHDYYAEDVKLAFLRIFDLCEDGVSDNGKRRGIDWGAEGSDWWIIKT